MQIDFDEFEGWLNQQTGDVGFACTSNDDPLSRWLRSQHPNALISVQTDHLFLDGEHIEFPSELTGFIADLDAYGNGEITSIPAGLAQQILKHAKSKSNYKLTLGLSSTPP